MLPRYVALGMLLVFPGFSPSAEGAEADTEADEEVLRAAKLPVAGSDLLALFRKRTPDRETQAHLHTLITQLGSESFLEREEASEELASTGVPAAGLLRQAAAHRDLEVRRRAREALALVEQSDLSEEVLIAALHLLAQRRPPRATEVLLAYAAHSGSADITEALCQALGALAVKEGEANPLLVRSLNASSSLQRSVAATVLCQTRCRKHFSAVRRLLRDANPEVRYHVALALLEARDKAAIPVLIDLLPVLPLAESERIESVLLQLAPEAPPEGLLDEDAVRARSQAAWADWWKKHADTLDLATLPFSPHWRGYTLAVCMGALRGRGARVGCIVELDARGRTRWQLQGLSYPVDAQVLDERRVLVTEFRAGQVTERNRNGDVLRRIEVSDSPLEARRLPNGHTLITTRSRVFEVDRHDKEVWSTKGNGSDTIVAVCSLPGGEIGIWHRSGEFVRQKRNGKTVASFQVGAAFSIYGTHIQGLPNGHILLPLFGDNKVVELDDKGNEVWSIPFNSPISAQRLPNGHTLVAGYRSNDILEVDRSGREVKSQHCDGRLLFARGR